MPLYKKDKDKLKSINEKKISLERDVQKLAERNLGEIFGLEFVKSEFSLGGFKIDTLAFNEETRSFVIIEYKKDKSSSVVDQGYAYMPI